MKGYRADLLLILTAAIWGLAFVAQRVGMEHLGPFAFNGIRFALGSVTLLPFVLRRRPEAPRRDVTLPRGQAALRVAVIGVVLFGAASLQQVGMVYTTAGKGGFITGLYVILIPLAGLALGHRPGAGTWAGAALATVGLYLVSVREGLAINPGDALVLASAALWAAHVLLVGWLAPRVDPLRLAAGQFAVCSALSLAAAAALETTTAAAVAAGAAPLLYGGVLSVGVAYTLQVVAQRTARPAHSAIIMSLEGAFAALGGWAVLGETLDARGLFGCGLMLAGMVLSQRWGRRG